MLTLVFCASIKSQAQGWPANYNGVMLQGFYWDSFDESQWTNLESQADELSGYFSLIWVPNSAYCNTLSGNMGYFPIYWFNQTSTFGSETALRSMIKTFKEKGTGIIEDVVINHKAGVSNWCDFATETWNGKTISWTLADICKGDDGGKTEKAGYKVTGAADTGEDFDGCRDLDHTSANVQNNVKTYLDFLLNDLGYTGFRYDFVKGFAAKYVGQYNTSAKPQFSVGECWDGNINVVKNWINGTKVDGVIQSAAFDFPLRYSIRGAFGNGAWYALNQSSLAADKDYQRYAVTFVDNHDTGSSGKDGADPLYANVEAANAYILAMPGTPCVFISHWKSYKTAIKKLITLRRLLGINSQSEIVSAATAIGGYILNVKGTKGNALLAFGNAAPANTAGYKLAMEGTAYKYYVPTSTDISALDEIKDVEDPEFKIPDFCKMDEGETCAFFEAPSTWTTVYCWRWDKTGNYTTNKWPGVKCEKIGKADNGNNVWKWSWNGNKVAQASTNEGIIFNNNGSQQTADLPFTNGGYYATYGIKGTVTDISDITAAPATKRAGIYTLSGQRIDAASTEALPHGIYIVNGKKIAK